MNKSNDILYPNSLREVWKWKEDVSLEISKSTASKRILNEKQNIKKIAKTLKLKTYSR